MFEQEEWCQAPAGQVSDISSFGKKQSSNTLRRKFFKSLLTRSSYSKNLIRHLVFWTQHSIRRQSQR